MRANPLVLVVDDDKNTLCFIADTLEYLGCDVEFATNGDEALKKARELKPDLIILDIMIPGKDGYEVCRNLKADPQTRSIRIIIVSARSQRKEFIDFTNGADYFIGKPYKGTDLVNYVWHSLKRSMYVPFPVPDAPAEYTFKLSCCPEAPMKISVSGIHRSEHWSDDMLKINQEHYARKGKQALEQDSQLNRLTIEEELCDKFSHTQDCGKELYHAFFRAHPKVGENYKQYMGKVENNRHLHLHFEAAQSFLRVPLEFLFEERGQSGDHLILRHPMYRSVTDVHGTRDLLSPDFFNELRLKGQALKILLIASNTAPDICGVDKEIDLLQGELSDIFEKQRIATEITSIGSDKATFKEVSKLLKHCQYHIVHYAGHGTHYQGSPTDSCLYFWEEENHQGKILEMTTAQLTLLLQESEVRFVYLSCCYGTATANPAQLLAESYLGIADGIIQAGVPAVLGFRRPVSDSGAPKLARAFYQSLAECGQIDTALLDARLTLHAEPRRDITWLSPILIMQS